MTSEFHFELTDSIQKGSDPVATVGRLADRMLQSNERSEVILSCLVTAAEAVAGVDAVSSILVLDSSGLLRNGASPRLPADYLQAIDKLKPNAKVGTCAAAAATGTVVFTPSFLADEKWAELRHLPLALGFVGAWSMPIKSVDGERVLGTFGTYFRSAHKPTDREVDAVGALAAIATRVLSRGAPA